MADSEMFTFPSAAQALSASSTKTLILVDPGNARFRVKEFGIGFDAAAAGQAVRVEFYRVTTIGTPAGTSVTGIKGATQSQACLAAGLANLSAEPTTVEILKIWYVPPNGGELVIQNPLGDEEIAEDGGDERYGLRAITPSSVTPNAVSYMKIAE